MLRKLQENISKKAYVRLQYMQSTSTLNKAVKELGFVFEMGHHGWETSLPYCIRVSK